MDVSSHLVAWPAINSTRLNKCFSHYENIFRTSCEKEHALRKQNLWPGQFFKRYRHFGGFLNNNSSKQESSVLFLNTFTPCNSNIVVSWTPTPTHPMYGFPTQPETPADCSCRGEYVRKSSISCKKDYYTSIGWFLMNENKNQKKHQWLF
jgi:hypothetical protein